MKKPKKTRKPAKAKKPKAKAKAKAKARARSAKKPARPKARARRGGVESHPGYVALITKLKPGRYAGGALILTRPGAHDAEMAPWLMGKTEGRKSLGRTAFGDFVIFRDLSARAQELGLPHPEEACDVALIDVHYKKMTMLADSASSFISSLDDDGWQLAFMRKELYEAAKERVGDYADDECFMFVPALALGGSEDAQSVQRGKWREHQSILFQT